MTLGINILIDGISIMNNTDKNKFDHSKDCRLPTAFQKKRNSSQDNLHCFFYGSKVWKDNPGDIIMANL